MALVDEVGKAAGIDVKGMSLDRAFSERLIHVASLAASTRNRLIESAQH